MNSNYVLFKNDQALETVKTPTSAKARVDRMAEMR